MNAERYIFDSYDQVSGGGAYRNEFLEVVEADVHDALLGAAALRALAASGTLLEPRSAKDMLAKEGRLLRATGARSRTALALTYGSVFLDLRGGILTVLPTFVDKPVHGYGFSRNLDNEIVTELTEQRVGFAVRAAAARFSRTEPRRAK